MTIDRDYADMVQSLQDQNVLYGSMSSTLTKMIRFTECSGLWDGFERTWVKGQLVTTISWLAERLKLKNRGHAKKLLQRFCDAVGAKLEISKHKISGGVTITFPEHVYTMPKKKIVEKEDVPGTSIQPQAGNTLSNDVENVLSDGNKEENKGVSSEQEVVDGSTDTHVPGTQYKKNVSKNKDKDSGARGPKKEIDLSKVTDSYQKVMGIDEVPASQVRKVKKAVRDGEITVDELLSEVEAIKGSAILKAKTGSFARLKDRPSTRVKDDAGIFLGLINAAGYRSGFGAAYSLLLKDICKGSKILAQQVAKELHNGGHVWKNTFCHQQSFCYKVATAQ